MLQQSIPANESSFISRNFQNRISVHLEFWFIIIHVNDADHNQYHRTQLRRTVITCSNFQFVFFLGFAVKLFPSSPNKTYRCWIGLNSLMSDLQHRKINTGFFIYGKKLFRISFCKRILKALIVSTHISEILIDSFNFENNLICIFSSLKLLQKI